MTENTKPQTEELTEQDLEAVNGGTSVQGPYQFTSSQGPYQLKASDNYCPRFIDINSTL